MLNDIRAEVEAIDLPDGYRLEWWGEYRNSNKAQGALAASLPAFLGMMVLITIALFRHGAAVPGCVFRLDGRDDCVRPGLRNGIDDGRRSSAVLNDLRHQGGIAGKLWDILSSCFLKFTRTHAGPALESAGEIALV